MGTGDKLLKRMRQSEGGWKPHDLDKLYRYFGFTVREGGKHRIYTHGQYPSLYATVKRGDRLGKGYIKDAIQLIDKLAQFEKKNEGTHEHTES